MMTVIVTCTLHTNKKEARLGPDRPRWLALVASLMEMGVKYPAVV